VLRWDKELWTSSLSQSVRGLLETIDPHRKSYYSICMGFHGNPLRKSSGDLIEIKKKLWDMAYVLMIL
jgi:hypothetical protein